jgi:hypothetical protein
MLVGDTTEASFMLSADEITACLALASQDVFGAAAVACRSLAAAAAQHAASFSILAGQLDVDPSSIPGHYLKLAEKYEALVGSTDTTAYFVDWGRRMSKVDGSDETDYDDDTDDDAVYFQDYNEDGDV